jgi:hypothetical protein
MVLDALKKRLHDAANSKGGKWIKELPNALWGLRTQPSKPTGQSPYFLVYGSEAILHSDVIWDSPAVEHYDEGVSEDSTRVYIFRSSSGGFCAPLSNRGLALHLRQELFYSGGWAATTLSCLPHRVPDTFVALLHGLGRRHLLQARKLRHQHATSRHKYSTTFFKMAYLSGCGLGDLELFGHALAGHIARLPWRRGQTSI